MFNNHEGTKIGETLRTFYKMHHGQGLGPNEMQHPRKSKLRTRWVATAAMNLRNAGWLLLLRGKLNGKQKFSDH